MFLSLTNWIDLRCGSSFEMRIINIKTRVLVCEQEENDEGRPRVATLVSSLANYSATVQAPTDPDAADKPKKASPKLGTLAGVYFPCMQNIFGVILFIRLTWIIGTAGVIQGFLLVTLCCTCVSLCMPFNSGSLSSIDI